ncbi:MAG: NUDIX domain-containing protein [Patescibacteria group bacterium]
MADQTLIPVVNEDDEIIDYKRRDLITTQDIYRVSALWLVNSQKEILLAKRALTKSHDPGKWGPAVAGTVEQGEDYDSNIIKEALEEIGLKDFEFKKMQKVRRQTNYDYFTQWYLAVVDQEINEFKINKAEVIEVKWFKLNELEVKIIKKPMAFLPSVVWAIKQFK